MGQEDSMGRQVRFGVRDPPRSHLALAIAQDGAAPWLVERYPMLNAIAKAIETKLRVMGEASWEFRTKQAIAFI